MKLPVYVFATAFLAGSAAAFVSRTGPIQNNAVSLIARGGASNSNNNKYSSTSTTARNMAFDAMEFAKKEIESNDVTVFSKSYCPYCTATKTVFEKMDGVDAKVIELDLDDNGQAIQDALLEISGQKTVPNVFVKGNHIGGNDDTQLAAKMGKIKKMLAE